MNCNKECKYYAPFQNTEECKLCICRFNDDYIQVEYNGECVYQPKTLTCKECDRFGKDYACMTADADDPVNSCPGFIDKAGVEISNILYDKFINGYSKEMLKEVIETVSKVVDEEFKVPYEEE